MSGSRLLREALHERIRVIVAPELYEPIPDTMSPTERELCKAHLKRETEAADLKVSQIVKIVDELVREAILTTAKALQ